MLTDFLIGVLGSSFWYQHWHVANEYLTADIWRNFYKIVDLCCDVWERCKRTVFHLLHARSFATYTIRGYMTPNWMLPWLYCPFWGHLSHTKWNRMTHVAVFILYIISQFHFMQRNNGLSCPVGSRSRWVRMDVTSAVSIQRTCWRVKILWVLTALDESLLTWLLNCTCDEPCGMFVAISAVIDWYNVSNQTIHRTWFKATKTNL